MKLAAFTVGPSSPTTAELTPNAMKKRVPVTRGQRTVGLNDMSRIELTLNGKAVAADVEDRTLLVNFLRDAQQLTGTHVGCDTSQCGACTVLVDGRALKSCTLLAVQVSGSKVTTIEGMANGEALHPVQQAFSECHGLQRGYCTPGMVMAVTDPLRRNLKPTEEQILHGLEGNICRCTGYINIVKSAKRASELMAAG